jgi:hypothetical protein
MPMDAQTRLLCALQQGELDEGQVSVGPENPYGPFMRFSRNILL